MESLTFLGAATNPSFDNAPIVTSSLRRDSRVALCRSISPDPLAWADLNLWKLVAIAFIASSCAESTGAPPSTEDASVIDATDGTEPDVAPVDVPSPDDAPASADAFERSDVTTTDVVADSDVSTTPSQPLPATVSCAPSKGACTPLPPVTELFASYRKDRYFEDEIYDEYTAYPTDGGRFHIAGVAAATGTVTTVALDGVDMSTLLQPPSPRIEWFHVYPSVVTAGEPIWVAFHSRDPAFDVATTGTIRVETDGGVALDGTFPVAIATAPLTSITLSADRKTLLVHVRNDGDTPVTATRLLVNGRDVQTGGVACIADPAIAPGDAALWTVPLCEAMAAGTPVTVVVDFDGAPASVGVLRALRPHFPVEAWGVGSDCAVPGANDAAFQAHLDAGFDTFYLYWGGNAECGYETSTLVNDVFPESWPGVHALVGDDFLKRPSPETAITDPTAVAGFLTGDESDGEIYLEDGSPKPATKAADAKRLWEMYPELTVYNGAMTNGNVGTFAGMVDVQGIDAYMGACAPYITAFEKPRPPRVVHDYLRNTRDNHMPLTTWFYAQGLHSGWNVGEDPVRHVQPAPQEILTQAMMVLTAGGKGLMWFQTDQDEAAVSPERWKAIADANWAIRAVRDLVREGDITGAATTNAGDDVLIEAIRSRDAIVVPLVALATDNVVDYVACIEWIVALTPPPAWTFSAQTVDVSVRVPPDLAVAEVFEVEVGGGLADVAWASDGASRTLTLPDISLSNASPVRLFVLAATSDVRERVEAVLSTRPTARTPTR